MSMEAVLLHSPDVKLQQSGDGGSQVLEAIR